MRVNFGIIQVNAVVGNDVGAQNTQGFQMLKRFFSVFCLNFGQFGKRFGDMDDQRDPVFLGDGMGGFQQIRAACIQRMGFNGD